MPSRRKWYAELGRLNNLIMVMRATVAEEKQVIARTTGDGVELQRAVDCLRLSEKILRAYVFKRQILLAVLARYPITSSTVEVIHACAGD